MISNVIFLERIPFLTFRFLTFSLKWRRTGRKVYEGVYETKKVKIKNLWGKKSLFKILPPNEKGSQNLTCNVLGQGPRFWNYCKTQIYVKTFFTWTTLNIKDCLSSTKKPVAAGVLTNLQSNPLAAIYMMGKLFSTDQSYRDVLEKMCS